MAIYKDKKTGAIIACDSVLSGDWEEVKETVKKTTKKAEAK